MAVVKALQNKEKLEVALSILELNHEEHILFARQLCLVARYAFMIHESIECVGMIMCSQCSPAFYYHVQDMQASGLITSVSLVITSNFHQPYLVHLEVCYTVY